MKIRTTIIIGILSIFLLSMVSAYGDLKTANIGKSVNLNETNQAELLIKTHNPTEDIISVNLEKKEFIDITTEETLNLEINIENPSYSLNPGEDGESKVIITNLQEGHIKGEIGVTFSKEGVEQKTTLNSVIKLNVKNSSPWWSPNNIYFNNMWRNMGIAIGIIFILLIGEYIFRKKPDNRQYSSEFDNLLNNRKDYKPLEPYTFTPSKH